VPVIGDFGHCLLHPRIHGGRSPPAGGSGYPADPDRLWLRCSAVFNKLPELGPQRAPSLRASSGRSSEEP